MSDSAKPKVDKQAAEEAARAERLKTRLIGAVALIAVLFIVVSVLPAPEGPDANPDYVVLDLEPPLTDATGGKSISATSQIIPSTPKLDTTLDANNASQKLVKPELAQPEQKKVVALKPAPQIQKPVSKPAPKVQQKQPKPVAKGRWWVQVASLSDRERADDVMQKLNKMGYSGTIQVAEVGGVTRYRLRLGPYTDRTESIATQKKLATQGYNGSALIQLN